MPKKRPVAVQLFVLVVLVCGLVILLRWQQGRRTLPPPNDRRPPNATELRLARQAVGHHIAALQILYTGKASGAFTDYPVASTAGVGFLEPGSIDMHVARAFRSFHLGDVQVAGNGIQILAQVTFVKSDGSSQLLYYSLEREPGSYLPLGVTATPLDRMSVPATPAVNIMQLEDASETGGAGASGPGGVDVSAARAALAAGYAHAAAEKALRESRAVPSASASPKSGVAGP